MRIWEWEFGKWELGVGSGSLGAGLWELEEEGGGRGGAGEAGGAGGAGGENDMQFIFYRTCGKAL